MARYGIPEIENRPAPNLQGGAYRPTGTRNVSDLWAAIQAEDRMGQQAAARAAMAQRAIAGIMGQRQRGGLQRQGMAPLAQAGASQRPAQQMRNPILESLAAQEIQGAMTKANLDMMRQIIASRQPSGMQQAMGIGIPLLGLGVGGMLGGLAGASSGMGIGSGLAGIFNSY